MKDSFNSDLSSPMKTKRGSRHEYDVDFEEEPQELGDAGDQADFGKKE
jgi:hypothetical protein